jgi:DNA-binding SARP family transcriptional activator
LLEGATVEQGEGGSLMIGNRVVLRLFGGFELRSSGAAVDIPLSSQRLVAFLALHDRSLPRSYVAATLWPDTTDEKAAANLRTAIWRLHRPDFDVVDAGQVNIALRPDVWVDTRFVAHAAREQRTTGSLPPFEMLDGVRGELLPGHWDSWLVLERERLRQLAIRLFEQACASSLTRGDTHLAVLLALAAVEQDPLRESSNVWLIKAFLADAGRTDALRHYERYSALLRSELGASPARHVEDLVYEPMTMS